jgi:hypothetical protein
MRFVLGFCLNWLEKAVEQVGCCMTPAALLAGVGECFPSAAQKPKAPSTVRQRERGYWPDVVLKQRLWRPVNTFFPLSGNTFLRVWKGTLFTRADAILNSQDVLLTTGIYTDDNKGTELVILARKPL